MPCLRHTSTVFAPASCSLRSAIICSSLNRLPVPLLGSRVGLYSNLDEFHGAQVTMGLQLPSKSPKRRVTPQRREDLSTLIAANQVWTTLSTISSSTDARSVF